MERPTAVPIRALFFDIDGTLLNSKGKILSSTLAALQACIRGGIRVFAATGRPPNLAMQLSLPPEQAALVNEGVFLNGAWVRLGGKDDFRPMEGRTAWRLIEASREDPDVAIALQLCDGRHAFSRPLPEAEWGHWGLSERADFAPFPGSPAELPAGILKIILFERSEGRLGGKSLSHIHAALEGLCSLSLTDGGSVIQAMEASVSKKSGVERVMAALGLGPEEIAVFGDDANDAEMLSAFPYSVAMGNAPPRVAALARYRTAGNDEEGIARALKDFLGLPDR